MAAAVAETKTIPFRNQEMPFGVAFEEMLITFLKERIEADRVLSFVPFHYRIEFGPLNPSKFNTYSDWKFEQEDVSKILNSITYDTVIFSQKHLEMTIDDSTKTQYKERIKDPKDFILTKTSESGITMRDIMECCFRFLIYDNDCLGSYVEWIQELEIVSETPETVSLLLTIGSGT